MGMGHALRHQRLFNVAPDLRRDRAVSADQFSAIATTVDRAGKVVWISVLFEIAADPKNPCYPFNLCSHIILVTFRFYSPIELTLRF